MKPGVNVMISYKLGGVGMFLVVLSCKISVVFLKKKINTVRNMRMMAQTLKVSFENIFHLQQTCSLVLVVVTYSLIQPQHLQVFYMCF
jgi:hypothetical protein